MTPSDVVLTYWFPIAVVIFLAIIAYLFLSGKD